MKRIKLIAAICLMTFAASTFAQDITPAQLKRARMAVYDWVLRNYKDRLPYEKAKRSEDQLKAFEDLFISDDILIYNDLYAQPKYDFNNTEITVSEYAKQAQNDTSFFSYVANVKNLTFEREYYDDGTLVFEIHFDKMLKAYERGNMRDDSYKYPERTIPMKVILVGVMDNTPTVKAISLQPREKIDPFLLLHDGKYSYYTTKEEEERKCIQNTSPYVSTTTFYPIPLIDDKVVSIKKDTIKQNIHVSPYIGGAFYTSGMLDTDMRGGFIRPSLSLGAGFGYYRQYKLTDKYRFGMEINASYLYSTLDYSGTYYTAYNAIDPVGSDYERRIKLDNYNEVIRNHAFYLSFTPIRQDLLFFTNNQHWSFYWSLGVFASYSFKQTAHAVADAKYTGYYANLFDVEFVDLYGFGEYKLNEYSNQTAMSKLNVGLSASLGFQYFIPRSHWSIEPSIRFQSSLYMPLTKENDFHIIDSSGKWRSATYLFNSMYMQNIGFQLNINYNFK